MSPWFVSKKIVTIFVLLSTLLTYSPGISAAPSCQEIFAVQPILPKASSSEIYQNFLQHAPKIISALFHLGHPDAQNYLKEVLKGYKSEVLTPKQKINMELIEYLLKPDLQVNSTKTFEEILILHGRIQFHNAIDISPLSLLEAYVLRSYTGETFIRMNKNSEVNSRQKPIWLTEIC